MSASTPITLAEIDAMAAALPKLRDRAAFLLACGCGLRAGTLCALSVGQLLDPNHRLTGRIEITRKQMKGAHLAHALEIPERALYQVALWLAAHPAPHRQAPLWPSETKKEKNITTRQWQRIISTAAAAAGVPGHVSPHSCRKFFAHAIYEATSKDIQLTTRALGNKSPMSTLHYLDFGSRKIATATLNILGETQQQFLSDPNTEIKSPSPNLQNPL